MVTRVTCGGFDLSLKSGGRRSGDGGGSGSPSLGRCSGGSHARGVLVIVVSVDRLVALGAGLLVIIIVILVTLLLLLFFLLGGSALARPVASDVCRGRVGEASGVEGRRRVVEVGGVEQLGAVDRCRAVERSDGRVELWDRRLVVRGRAADSSEGVVASGCETGGEVSLGREDGGGGDVDASQGDSGEGDGECKHVVLCF